MITLHVTIGTDSDRSDLEDKLGQLDAGEDIDATEPRLSIESIETFGKIFRPTNLALLEAIVEHEPESIRELARIVDRHPPEVHGNIHELVDYGLVELKETGRSKRPVVWYDDIDVAIPLSQNGPISPDLAES